MTPPHFVLGAILVLLGVILLACAAIVAASTWIVVKEKLDTAKALRERNR